MTGNPQDGTPSWTFQAVTQGSYYVQAANPDETHVRRYIHSRDPLNNQFNASPGEAVSGRIYDERHYTASGQMLRCVLTDWGYTGPQQ